MRTDATPSDDDAALLDAAAGGDSAAFETLFRRHAPWLMVRLRYRCADASLVDDVVQETFLAIWRGGVRLPAHHRGEVAGWLWRIASRRLIDALRRRGAGDRLWQRLTRWRAENAASAEDLVLIGVHHGDLGVALARLSPELQAVVQATILDGLSTRETSILLGIPAGTVKTRAMRARAQLRQELA